MVRRKSQSTVLTRREFLAVSTASLILVSKAKPEAEGLPWYATMRRCGQINFNERDPLSMAPEEWMDYWASLKVDALLLNGGGIVAFYPTDVPLHHRTQFLGSRDLFGEAVAAAKKRQIRVVARMDCNLAWEDALRARPEWFQRSRDGSPRTDTESPWLYRTCMFSGYFTEQMPAIYREINQRYTVDGFFTNGWPGTGALTVCYCESCQKVYRDQVGGVPPENTDATSLLYRKYYDVYMDRIVEIWKLWDTTVKQGRPDVVYVGNLGGGIRAVKSLKRLSDVARWFNADHQGRSGDMPIWDCAQQGRVAQSVMKGRTITNVTGAYSNSRVIWRHVAKSPAETTLWLAQTAASGMVPWFHWLGGSPEDHRWREVGRSFYQWLAANDLHFRNRRSIAELAVLYPQNMIAFYGSGGAGETSGERIRTTDYIQGLYYALLEGRFIFDFVHQEELTADLLRRYRALLIPNAAFLRDAECEAIRRYVVDGGSLLATFETSRYNEWGDPRPDFALSDLFGATLSGKVIGPFHNSYMRIERPHPITARFEGTSLLPGAEYRVPVRPLEAAPLTLSVVPHYPWYPPEQVYARTPRTDQPAVLPREKGLSRLVYFPGDIDRTLWRSGNTDLSQLVQNAVAWVLGSRQSVNVTGEGIIELFAWETEAGYALHILNYTNPNMTRGFVRRFYEISPQQVEFELPPGRAISQVCALRAGKTLAFRQVERAVTFETPAIRDFEVVALT